MKFLGRAALAGVVALAFLMVSEDLVVTKWKVQKQVPPDAWVWTVHAYARSLLIIAAAWASIGPSVFSRLFSRFGRIKAAVPALYYTILGVLIGSWYTLVNILARA